MTDTKDPWADLYDAIPRGWVVGRLPFDETTNTWRLYCYERRGTAAGASATLEAQAQSEEQAVREMTRKLKRVKARR
jgi:hypothetical protein